MALPSASQVSFSDIQTEHGGSSPISLSEYYAGGSYVYSGTTGNNGAIPSSGEISVDDLRGSATVQTLSTRFSNANAGYYTADITPSGISNAAALDSSYATYNWTVTPETGDMIRFYNPVSTLPADAQIIDIEFEATWGSGATAGTKRLFPRVQDSASSMVTPVSTTPDVRMVNISSMATDSMSGSPSDWGVTNAQAVSACRQTSSSSTSFPTWTIFCSNAGTPNTDTDVDSVRLIIQYVQ